MEQLKSKQLSDRTNDTKLFLKNIQKDNPIWEIFIAHPAKVMVKKPDSNRYEQIREF